MLHHNYYLPRVYNAPLGGALVESVIMDLAQNKAVGTNVKWIRAVENT